MVDYFALLNFGRTPWLDPAEVQARFLELSAAAHPDRVHNLGGAEREEANRNFAELNKAASVLRENKERLQHLIAVESGAALSATQNIPAEFIDLFSRIGPMCRNVDQFLAERSRAASPMLQAQLFAKGLELSDGVVEMQGCVGEVKAKAEAELKTIAAGWPRERRFDRLAGLANGYE